MNEDFSTGLAKDKPRITFVSDATIRFNWYIGCTEKLAHTEEVRQFLIAPILLGIGEEAWQGCGDKTTQADGAILIYVEGQCLRFRVQEMLLWKRIFLLRE
jgi:hypothetical protein